ncbi:hypothetical protein ACN28C_04405 [Plantactinospora sp. WMMC1484]|uniref:hypothetical protein n=1 Tax=Plantactinospora sp. WMMC1484 TaxID=3404122 RepID=UPI003BF4BF0C
MSSIYDSPRLKHLEFLQAVIARMGNISLRLKGWTATLATALLSLSAERHSWPVMAASLLPIFLLWCVDGYYLRQERLFRRLYDAVRLADDTVESMEMSPSRYRAQITWAGAARSVTLVAFYGMIVTVALGFVAIGALTA